MSGPGHRPARITATPPNPPAAPGAAPRCAQADEIDVVSRFGQRGHLARDPRAPGHLLAYHTDVATVAL